MEFTPEHAVAMAVRSIQSGLEELDKLITELSEQDQENLERARFEIEVMLAKARNPYLMRAAE